MSSNFDRLYTVELFKKIKYNRTREFQDIVALAAEICETPIALITLLDDTTNTFIAKVGLEVDEGSTETSFCQYTIQDSKVLTISDTLLDDRFINNPVVYDKGVRAYAGAPLSTSNGYKIGSLCVIDMKPKTFTPIQIRTLEVLSRQATMLMELELGQKLMTENKADLDSQKKVLMNIAEVQSHMFRGPVASLLGMMNIIAEEDYVASKEYLLMMEEQVKVLDEKIHMIVEYTHVI